jgi:hypothetical protein
VERDHAVGIEARVGGMERDEAPDQERRRNKEYQAERDFDGDQ